MRHQANAIINLFLCNISINATVKDWNITDFHGKNESQTRAGKLIESQC